MTIRPAKFVDTPRLVDLLVEGFARSKYVGRGSIDLAVAKQLFLSAIQRTETKGPGGSCVFVSEAGDGGAIQGFIVGILDRVYHVGDRLTATDLWFYVAERAGPRAFLGLLDAFEAWADANPKVIEIKLGVTDVIDGADAVERLGKVYARRGYRPCGTMFERRIDR